MSPSASSINTTTAGSEATTGATLQETMASKLALGDVQGWLACDDSDSGMKHVWDNRFVLRTMGLYEHALILAVQCGTWHRRADRRAMFDFGSRPALRLAGNPLPPGDRFTVYRGVAGEGHDRLVRGYSWTLDKYVARLFAQLFGGPNPQLYETMIEERHVLTYIHQSFHGGLRVEGVSVAEREMILYPRNLPHVKRIPYVPPLPITTPMFNGECGCGCGEQLGDEAGEEP
jgi:hypothetical protein